MSDYRNYVSFEIPDDLLQKMAQADPPIDPARAVLTPADRIKMEMALTEIAATPEGEKLLRDAAALGENGKIHIIRNEDGYSMAANPATIILGTEDSGVRYLSSETGKMHDLSIQRLMIHELSHLTLGHHQHRGDEKSDGFSPSEEAEAVVAENTYMKKYYGEAARNPLMSLENTNFHGTPNWDYSTARLAKALDGMTPEQLESAGPEMQSLHIFRNSPEHLGGQLEDMAIDGSLETVKDQLLELLSHETEPLQPKPAPEQPRPAPTAHNIPGLTN